MGGWLVVAGLLAVGVMLWLDARPSSWWFSRRAFEEPAELAPPRPLERPPEPRLDRPVRGVLVRPPLGELEGRRGRSS
jgi:hypothetical protein